MNRAACVSASGGGTRLILVAVVGIACGACIADQRAANPPMAIGARPDLAGRPVPARPRLAAPSTLQSRQLPSGLLVLLDQDPYAVQAGVVSIVEGGSSADPVGSEGLAHLVEHLTFRALSPGPDGAPQGARRRADRESRRERLVRLAAVETNGLTSADAITFYEFGPAASLLGLFDLEAQRLGAPLAGVDQSSLEIERQIIASEYQLRDDPRVGLWATSHLVPLLFRAPHPYARAPSGTPQSRDNLTMAAARAYAAANFRPERMTLLVTAPADTVDLDSLIRRLPPALIGDAANPVARPFSPAVDAAPPLAGHQLTRVSSPLRTQQLWLAWVLPAGAGRSAALQTALAQWVQEDLDTKDLRRNDPHVRQTLATLISGREAAVLGVRILVKEGADLDRIAEIVTQTVSTLWTREASGRDGLGGLQASFGTQVALGQPPQVTRAVEEAARATLSARPTTPQDWVQEMSSVSAAELSAMARRLLSAERRQAVVFTPTQLGQQPPTPVKPARQANPGALFREALSWDGETYASMTAPLSSVAAQRLANGLTLIVARRRSGSTVAWLGFHGGYGDADPPLLVQIASRARPDAVAAARQGALSSRTATIDASVETFEFSPPSLGPALAGLLAKGTVGLQGWPSAEALDRMVASVDLDLDPASKKANRDFRRALFGAHPFASTLDVAELPSVKRAAVDAWIRRVHDLRNAVLIVVGDVDAAQVAAYVRALSPLPAKSPWQAWPAPSPPDLRPPGEDHVTAVLTSRPGTMTDVALGCLLPPMRATTRAEYEILRLAMEQRLLDVLRFQKGETYNVSVGLEWLRGGATDLQISIMADAGALADVLETLHGQWRRWGSAGFSDGELAVGRRLYAGAVSSAYSSGHTIAFHLFNDWNADPASAGRDTFSEDPSSVKALRLGELFTTCRANAVLGVTGDAGVIGRAVASTWPEAR